MLPLWTFMVCSRVKCNIKNIYFAPSWNLLPGEASPLPLPRPNYTPKYTNMLDKVPMEERHGKNAYEQKGEIL
jgi:hypothetical protein